MAELSDVLVFEILTWLPGKQVARCKCVCKPWRSMIDSRPFSETYRIRQRGLIMLTYWSGKGDSQSGGEDDNDMRYIRFFHGSLRRHDERPAEMNPLCELEFSDHPKNTSSRHEGKSHPPHGLTRVVNGLLCVGEVVESVLRLSLHNIGTGEKTRLQDPLPCLDSYSTYHLGYDPVSRVYKLMRLIFHDLEKYQYRPAPGFLLGAHIMTLRPPSSSQPPTWRELDYVAAGINSLDFLDVYWREMALTPEVTSSDEGFLCWICSYSPRGFTGKRKCLFSFDFDAESFGHVLPPHDFHHGTPPMLFHALARFKDGLALWASLSKDCEKNVISCYAMEDVKGENWSRRCREISEDFKPKQSKFFVLPFGNLLASSSSNGSMLAMDKYNMISSRGDQPIRVYSYSVRQAPHDAYGDEDLFFVGNLPEGAPNLYFCSPYHGWECLKPGWGEVSCLLDANNLYLPLDYILGASPTPA